MSKIILEFDIPDEHEEAKTATEAMAWKAAMTGVDEWLRSMLKHGDPNSIFKSAEDALDKAREILHDALSDKGLKLYE